MQQQDAQTTILHTAIHNGIALEPFKALVLAHADQVPITDVHNRSLLHMAAQHSNVQVLEYLLAAHVEQFNMDGMTFAQRMTPLMLAARHGHVTCLQLLLQHVNANFCNEFGLNALDIAKLFKRHEVVILLQPLLENHTTQQQPPLLQRTFCKPFISEIYAHDSNAMQENDMYGGYFWKNDAIPMFVTGMPIRIGLAVLLRVNLAKQRHGTEFTWMIGMIHRLLDANQFEVIAKLTHAEEETFHKDIPHEYVLRMQFCPMLLNRPWQAISMQPCTEDSTTSLFTNLVQFALLQPRIFPNKAQHHVDYTIKHKHHHNSSNHEDQVQCKHIKIANVIQQDTDIEYTFTDNTTAVLLLHSKHKTAEWVHILAQSHHHLQFQHHGTTVPIHSLLQLLSPFL